ncbi:MAG: RNA chaperone Hfq [Thermoanaerobaculum sp.]|nr:RNA chaperone Hfq [Thermoanaerobaculum sp.]MCX7895794.1 RNA chaperone Hfq [Thermoanaerobaculum sp.]MDW7968075.1 RNA chaperone Hfq [Thermoanaerobaculum sp.]
MEHSQAKTDVQDAFLASLRNEGKPIFVFLLTGRRLTGYLKRFDRYCVVLESHGQEQLIFKHAIASLCLARGEGEVGA